MVMESKDIKRKKYIPGETPIPEDRHAKNYIDFDDEMYLLSDVRDLGWNEEQFLPGHASNIFLFYKPTKQPKEKEGGGLKFVAFSFLSGDETDPESSVELEVIAQGYGGSDGVRHMIFGSSHNKGHVGYPDFGVLSKLMSRLYELQREYCGDVNDRK